MEQIFFTQKDQIGREKAPIEKMATGGVITPQKPIEKMTLLELQDFVREFDPIKCENMNWFKGTTRKGLRVQVKTIYDKYVALKSAETNSRSKMDDMDEIDEFAGGGTAGDRKSPTQSATSVQEGTLAIGNDGRFYATVLNKNSVGSLSNVDSCNFNDNFRNLSWVQDICGRA